MKGKILGKIDISGILLWLGVFCYIVCVNYFVPIPIIKFFFVPNIYLDTTIHIWLTAYFMCLVCWGAMMKFVLK